MQATYPSNEFFAQDLQSGNHFIKFALLFVDASICGSCSGYKRSCNICHLTIWYTVWHHVFTATKNEKKRNVKSKMRIEKQNVQTLSLLALAACWHTFRGHTNQIQCVCVCWISAFFGAVHDRKIINSTFIVRKNEKSPGRCSYYHKLRASLMW